MFFFIKNDNFFLHKVTSTADTPGVNHQVGEKFIAKFSSVRPIYERKSYEITKFYPILMSRSRFCPLRDRGGNHYGAGQVF